MNNARTYLRGSVYLQGFFLDGQLHVEMNFIVRYWIALGTDPEKSPEKS